jgi:hypothetical protein
MYIYLPLGIAGVSCVCHWRKLLVTVTLISDIHGHVGSPTKF